MYFRVSRRDVFVKSKSKVIEKKTTGKNFARLDKFRAAHLYL